MELSGGLKSSVGGLAGVVVSFTGGLAAGVTSFAGGLACGVSSFVGGVLLVGDVVLSIGTWVLLGGFVGATMGFTGGFVVFGIVLLGFVLFGLVTFGFGKVLLIFFSKSVRFLLTIGAELGGVGLFILSLKKP